MFNSLLVDAGLAWLGLLIIIPLVLAVALAGLFIKHRRSKNRIPKRGE